MNIDKLKDFLSQLGTRDLPTGAAVAVGIILLFFMFKMTTKFAKLALLLVAVVLFGGAYWLHCHQ